MKKIVLLPLDERPCNYDFPKKIFKNEKYELISPNKNILGNKKTPANKDKVREFLLKETKDAFGLVISIDMLLYGGIVPSRLHYFKEEDLILELDILKEIKKINPKIKIYAFHLIMRSPQYSSDDEEPDYYAKVGREIFLSGFLGHKKELGLLSKEEEKTLNGLKLPEKYLDDFLGRRKINTNLCLTSVNLANEDIIDFLIIPQDDAAEFGYTAKDQSVVRKEIENKTLQLKVYMYPGADEVANSLLSKMILTIENKKPLVYIYYPSVTSGMLIPRYEDRMLDTTVKYQILAAGGLTATSIYEADVVLFVNAPSGDMRESVNQHLNLRQYQTQRNLVDFVEQINYVVNQLNKPALIGDVAYSNGGDIELINMLESKDLLMKVASYAGWNTSSNTLGTAIPHGFMYWLFGNNNNFESFLASRYVEDVGYCSIVRQDVNNNHLPKLKFDYFYVKEERGLVSNIIKEELEKFVIDYLPSKKDNIVIDDLFMPWRRMFEIGLDVVYKK